MNNVPKEQQDKKISEVFLEYASPWLEMYLGGVEKYDLEEVKTVLQFPWLIWNSIAIKKSPNPKIDYVSSINLLLKDQPRELKVFIESMYERKIALFSQYDYLLGEFDVSLDEKNNEVKLWVEARTISKKN